MITSMFDILCVTNRKLCTEDFLDRIEKIASARPKAIILREKDLNEEEYKKFACDVIEICDEYGVLCILHSFVNVAKELNCKSIHLPLHILRTMSASDKAKFANIGASCHSIEEAIEAESLGCTYITAGNVFDTDCKKGLPGRGTVFLKIVCKSVPIPVYGIGGISAENIDQVRNTGAKGACIMSGAMICDDVRSYLNSFKEK